MSFTQTELASVSLRETVHAHTTPRNCRLHNAAIHNAIVFRYEELMATKESLGRKMDEEDYKEYERVVIARDKYVAKG